MARSVRGNWTRTSMLLCAVLLLAGATRPASAQRAQDDRPVDLAWMALGTDDLEQADLEGFRVRASGYLETADLVAEGPAREREDAIEALEETGVIASYTLTLDLIDPGDPDLLAQARVQTYISLHEDEDGAETGFALREDETGQGDSEDVPASEEIGDEAELSRFTGEDDEFDVSIVGLDYTFRTGPVYAGVRMMNVGPDPDELEEPDEDIVLTLAERLLERIEDGLDGGSAGLDDRVVSVRSDEVEITREGFYEFRDGVLLPRIGTSQQVLDMSIEIIEEYGAVDRFRVDQIVQVGEESAPTDPYALMTVTRFADAAAASAWLDDVVDRQEESGFYDSIDVIELDEDLGDRTVAHEYAYEFEEAELSGYAIYVQVDDLVSRVEVDGASLETVLELAEASADCLADGGCREPIDAPEDLLEG